MIAYLFVVLISLSMLLFSGCATFTPPKEHPVQQDTIVLSRILGVNTGSVFSLTPERRTLFVIPEVGTKLRICAEPPPDVAENLSSTLRLFAEAESKATEIPASVRAEFYKAFTATVTKLFYRSQGIQLFRDGMYSLCQAYVNNLIDKDKYIEMYEKLRASAENLIKAEIPTLKERQIEDAFEQAKEAENAAKAASNDAKISRDAAEKALEEARKILEEIKQIEKPK